MSNSENKRREKLETRILSIEDCSLLDYELLEIILYSVCEKGESRKGKLKKLSMPLS
ncbi:hypothetical protein [Wolbachia endosymbiont (group E) of Neria commutata]|uniref:hypothetical protein n=1 Tax=Wolbachia endosymbiont (group E) of Neria commutata TaxID=3066149 RepID=UPI003133063F